MGKESLVVFRSWSRGIEGKARHKTKAPYIQNRGHNIAFLFHRPAEKQVHFNILGRKPSLLQSVYCFFEELVSDLPTTLLLPGGYSSFKAQPDGGKVCSLEETGNLPGHIPGMKPIGEMEGNRRLRRTRYSARGRK